MCFCEAIADSQEWARLLLGLDWVDMDTLRWRLMLHAGNSGQQLRVQALSSSYGTCHRALAEVFLASTHRCTLMSMPS